MMAATTASTDGRTTTGRRTGTWLVGLALVGSALIVGGALLPWLSLYGGLDHLRGVDGTNGRVLLAGGLLAATVGLVYALRPSVSLRWTIGAIGFAASGFAAWDLSQLLGTYRELQADPFAVANLGPGAFLAVAGGLLVLGTMLLPSEAPERAMTVRPVHLDARHGLRNGMIVFLVGAAMIHLSVVGPHLQESTLYAVFFICAAIAQVGLAALLALRGGRTLLLGIAALNLLFMAVWVLSRTTGLPIGPQAGVPEGVSVSDVIATVEEGVAVLLAVLTLRIGPVRAVRRGIVSAGTAVVILAGLGATLVAVLASQGS